MEDETSKTFEFVDCGSYHIKLEPEDVSDSFNNVEESLQPGKHKQDGRGSANDVDFESEEATLTLKPVERIKRKAESFNVGLNLEKRVKQEPVDYEALDAETIEEESISTCLLTHHGIKVEPIECNFNENSRQNNTEHDFFLHKEWMADSELDVNEMKMEPKTEPNCNTQISLFSETMTYETELPSGEIPDASLPVPGTSIQTSQDGSGEAENCEAAFTCHMCPYRTIIKKNFDRHVAKHLENVCKTSASENKDKKFKCDLCMSRFSHQRSLTLHLKTVHAIKRPFKCNECSYDAARGNHLRLHVMSKHSGEKPVQCALCPYRCVQKGNMLDHIRNRHSGGEPFKCDRCRFQTSQRDDLIAHITQTHLSKVLKM